MRAFEKIEVSSKAVEVTVNNKEENSEDFYPDFVQEFCLTTGHNFLVMLLRVHYCCCVQARFLDKETIKYSFLVMVYSALFNNVFEAWNVIKKSAAETQLPGNVIRLLLIPKSSIRNLLAIGEFQHII